MALHVDTDFRFKNVHWKSGMVYSFKYANWRNDPNPTIILMYRIRGIHPNTGHQWRLIQGINFTYIPRPQRKHFAQAWIKEMENNGGRADLTWDTVQNMYPYMTHAVRRYMLTPAYVINDVKPIPFEEMEKAIVSTWSKDFSKKIRTDLAQKYRDVMGKRKKTGGFFSSIRNVFGR